MSEVVKARPPPIAWIAMYAAVCAATSLIPIFPYVGGGGYVPLGVPMAAIAPLILGPWGGTLAAFIGGLVGMFISPAAFPLGFIDVIITGTTPALFVGLSVNGNKRVCYVLFLLFFISQAVCINIIPYYVPGPAAGFPSPPQPIYFGLTLWYWLPWIIIFASPLGFKVLPAWARSEDRRKRSIGIFLTSLMGMMCWFIPWGWPYWYFYSYPVELTMTVLVTYTWWVPVMTVIVTVIATPILEGLRRSGLPKIDLAVY